MNYKEFLRSWLRPRSSAKDAGQQAWNGLQSVISVTCLRGWWRKERGNENDRSGAQTGRARPVTPWSHGLF